MYQITKHIGTITIIVGSYMCRAIAEYWQTMYNISASISNASCSFGLVRV